MATTISYLDPRTLGSDDLSGWEQLGGLLRYRLEARAKADAIDFRDEFHTATKIEGDWDSQAWEIARAELIVDSDVRRYENACKAAGHDVAWALYSEVLHAEVERLGIA